MASYVRCKVLLSILNDEQMKMRAQEHEAKQDGLQSRELLCIPAVILEPFRVLP